MYNCTNCEKPAKEVYNQIFTGKELSIPQLDLVSNISGINCTVCKNRDPIIPRLLELLEIIGKSPWISEAVWIGERWFVR